MMPLGTFERAASGKTAEQLERADLIAHHLQQAIAAGATLQHFIKYAAAKGDTAATEAEIAEAQRLYTSHDQAFKIDRPTLAARGFYGRWVLGWFWLKRRGAEAPQPDTGNQPDGI